ncbi:peptide chain release factor N(5)-glutamine methyltransferase [Sphingomonas jejuensis]|uniref:peptide chain release factor N(5)-glutamine methyltransferase n=1 Tax=Sphingomonas jejuensis TaxID=904715 RepID=UPI00143A96A8|nr:peptide chain release factor N(5)-glutamine methyltransferase [Sphingomonas jejuensis]
MGPAIRAAAARLATVSDTPRLDAELIAAQAAGQSRERMLLEGIERAPVPAGFDTLIERRMSHEPVAYLVGQRDFWTISLQVGPGVLVPRPDSETLIEAAVAAFSDRPPPRRVLDLGTGSGALLLAALDGWPDATGVGIDASPAALDWARKNAVALGMADRAEIRAGDWSGTGEAFDLILCNPPYIEDGAVLPDEVRRHEPASALFAGADGLDDYRVLARVLPGQLATGGIACVEIGWTQAEAAGALFRAAGLSIAVRRDLGGRDRCLLMQASEFALGKGHGQH